MNEDFLNQLLNGVWSDYELTTKKGSFVVSAVSVNVAIIFLIDTFKGMQETDIISVKLVNYDTHKH
jgi:hypothetical protein